MKAFIVYSRYKTHTVMRSIPEKKSLSTDSRNVK